MLVNEFLENSAEKSPDKTALVCGGERLSFSDIEKRSNSFGNALLDGHVERQDRVAIYLDNSSASVISLFGILKAGAVFLVIHPQVKAQKLEFILRDCQARVLVTDSKHLSRVSRALARCKDLEAIVVTDDENLEQRAKEEFGLTLLSYRSVLKDSPRTRPSRRNIDVDLAGLIYTSGSSGRPKGVIPAKVLA